MLLSLKKTVSAENISFLSSHRTLSRSSELESVDAIDLQCLLIGFVLNSSGPTDLLIGNAESSS